MRLMICFCFFLLALLPCAAQDDAATEKAQTFPRSRAQKIGTSIDILANVRRAIAQSHRNETETYKAVSMRLIQCAVSYQVFSKDRSADVETSAKYTDAADVYGSVAAFLYADNM